MKTALFGFIMQRVVVIPYRRFGTNYMDEIFFTLEDETDRLSRNVGKGLPLLAV